MEIFYILIEEVMSCVYTNIKNWEIVHNTCILCCVNFISERQVNIKVIWYIREDLVIDLREMVEDLFEPKIQRFLNIGG